MASRACRGYHPRKSSAKHNIARTQVSVFYDINECHGCLCWLDYFASVGIIMTSMNVMGACLCRVAWTTKEHLEHQAGLHHVYVLYVYIYIYYLNCTTETVIYDGRTPEFIALYKDGYLRW